MEAPALLALEGLTVDYAGPTGTVRAVDGLDLEVKSGEVLALVGPSGGGKTATALAVLGLSPRGARVGGRVLWRGRELPDAAARRSLAGRETALLFQDPGASLDPVIRVGDQLVETLSAATGRVRADARVRARELALEARLPDPDGALRRYPHQLSGGERQRTALALALAGEPSLLIADEPTTALDAATRRAVLALLADLVRRRGMSLVFITHDIALCRGFADRAARLDEGRLTASGAVSVLDVPAAPPSPMSSPIFSGAPALACRGVVVRHRGGEDAAPAVADVDLEVGAGEAVGLVGESGCGKTSLAFAICGHREPDAGEIAIGGAAVRPGRARRAAQLVFQSPGGSLDPRQTCGAALAEALRCAGRSSQEARTGVPGLLAAVGLDAALARRRPHGLSGGQRQRVAVARALAARPSLLVADEPTSSLDAAAQRELLDLLQRLRALKGWGLLLISHDLPLVRDRCHRTAVMFAGRIVEILPRGAAPRHPYARALMGESVAAIGDDPAALPSAPAAGGCPYASRCPLVRTACRDALPRLEEVVPGHRVRCPVTVGNPGTH